MDGGRGREGGGAGSEVEKEGESRREGVWGGGAHQTHGEWSGGEGATSTAACEEGREEAVSDLGPCSENRALGGGGGVEGERPWVGGREGGGGSMNETPLTQREQNFTREYGFRLFTPRNLKSTWRNQACTT